MKDQIVHAIIDLGSGTIKFLAGSIKNSKPIVYKLFSKRTSAQGFKDGKIINPKEVAKNIQESLKEVRKSLKLKTIESVSLSIPPEGMEVSKAVGSIRVNNQERIINSAVLTNAISAITTSIDQIEYKIIFNDPQVGYIDGQKVAIEKLKGQTGEKLEIHSLVYSIPKTVYEKYKYTLKLAGLNIAHINISPIAIINELAVDTNGTSMLVDIGHHKTYVSLFSKGRLAQSYTINWAGKHITYEIDQLMQVNNYGTVSTWKHKHAKLGEKNSTLLHVDDNGKKWTVGDLNKITARNILHIIRELQEIINQNNLADSQLDIVITGGSSNIINIDKFFSYYLKVDVRVYKPNTLGARKPEYTSMLGMLYSADRYAKQKMINDQNVYSLDISNWFKSEKSNRIFEKLKSLKIKKR